ncbi:protein Bouncer-like [Sphaeramia orbicularis]|uniref:protein Bouncer-like n=1 Tax=Sphaeramia orbicularis TaxID=375764 RepID=UPI00118026FA|nr:protein Bouncer-like [Sphaeramia orbicularis]
MNKLLWIGAALMVMFVTGECLVCRTCKMGLGGRCLFPSRMTCSDAQPNCYIGNMVLNVSKFMRMHARGCIASSLCNTTETGTLLTAGYTVSRTCCNTDCCNGATAIQIPLTAALGAAVMSVWSTWSH